MFHLSFVLFDTDYYILFTETVKRIIRDFGLESRPKHLFYFKVPLRFVGIIWFIRTGGGYDRRGTRLKYSLRGSEIVSRGPHKPEFHVQTVAALPNETNKFVSRRKKNIRL